MKLNGWALAAWAWGMFGDAVEGFGHGAIVGTGVGAVEGPTATFSTVDAMLVGGAIGAVKQAVIFIGTNRLPPLFVASTPSVSTVVTTTP